MSVKVAAVIVARNECKMIKDTIESIQEQTIEVKIVVIDDGSTDLTRARARAQTTVAENKGQIIRAGIVSNVKNFRSF